MRRRLTGVVVALALLGAACGDDDGGGASDGGPGGGTSTVGCDPAHVGGTLTMATGAASTALDPTQVLGASSGGMESTALYDTLLRYDAETGGYDPHLAESFERTSDLDWTVVLRAGVTFSNGKSLTTADLKANLDRMKAARVSSAALANLIDDVEIVDERTAIYHLAQPWGEFPYFLAEEGSMIVDTEVADAMGPEAFALNPAGAGAGPFVLERFAPGEEVVLRARQGYWGGQVCADTLRLVSPGGAQAALDSLQTGEVDVAFMTDPKVARDARDAGMTVIPVVSGAGDLLLLNQGAHGAVSPTDDVRIRRAVVAALDVDLLNERVYEGTALATSALTWDDQAIHPDVPGPAYDPDAAKALVAEAKADGWDGELGLLCRNTPEVVERAITVKALLEAVGMAIEVETIDSSAWLDRVANKGDYEIACWGGNIPDNSPWATVLTQYSSESATNRVGLDDPDVDAALVELREASDIESRRAAMARLQEAWNEVVPNAILTAQQWFVVHHPDVKDLVITRDAIAMFQSAYRAG